MAAAAARRQGLNQRHGMTTHARQARAITYVPHQPDREASTGLLTQTTVTTEVTAHANFRVLRRLTAKAQPEQSPDVYWGGDKHDLKEKDNEKNKY